MSINVLNLSGAIKVGSLAADPSSPQNGLIYYNTISNTFRKYENGSWTDLTDSSVTADVADLVTLSGVAANETDLGTFTGTTIPDDSDIKEALQSLETEVELKLDATEVGVSVASLVGGKVPVAQLPNAIMEYQGVYNATTNSPALANGGGNADEDVGNVYRVGTAGTQDFGAGNITFVVSDYVILNASKVWEKADTTDAVASVNGFTGIVVLGTDDVAEGATNKYFTDGRAQTATISQVITNGVTTKAPSEDAVFDALALKLANVVEDTTPQLGGVLDLNSQNVEGLLKRAAVGGTTSCVEEQYLHALTLTASQTAAVESSLTFAHASYEGLEVTYKIKEATTSRIRIGTLRIATNGTDTSIVDTFTETGDVGTTWTVGINGASLEVKYTTNANNKTMRADVKRFKV